MRDRRYKKSGAQLYLARPGFASSRNRRLERSLERCDCGSVRRRENGCHDCTGSNRDHGFVARPNALGGARWLGPADRARSSPDHAATLPGRSTGSPGNGINGDEHVRKYAWSWQRRHATRLARDARPRNTQPASQRGNERNVYFPGDQHELRAIDSCHGNCDSCCVWINTADGHCWHRAAGNILRGKRGDHFSKTSGETADVSSFSVRSKDESRGAFRESGS